MLQSKMADGQFRFTFLGTSAARPTARRGLSCVGVRAHQDRLLIDCGEGSQRQMLIYETGFRIDMVLFTHFHADHFLGIVGYLRTLAMMEHELPVTLYGPAEDIETLLRPAIFLGYRKAMPYPLHFVPLSAGDVIERPGYRIRVVAVEHGRPAVGYVFEEPPRPGRFDVNAARRLGVPVGPLFGRLQRGEAVTLPDGRCVRPEDVVGPTRPGRKMAFSGDTRPCDAFAEAAADADVLVHESTFARDEQERAELTSHSTAAEAGAVAQRAGAHRLILTHISGRHDQDPDPLAAQARQAFGGPVSIAEDGLTVTVPVRDAAV